MATVLLEELQLTKRAKLLISKEGEEVFLGISDGKQTVDLMTIKANSTEGFTTDLTKVLDQYNAKLTGRMGAITEKCFDCSDPILVSY